MLQKCRTLSCSNAGPSFGNLVDSGRQRTLLGRGSALTGTFCFVFSPSSGRGGSTRHRSFRDLFRAVLSIVIGTRNSMSLRCVIDRFSSRIIVIHSSRIASTRLLSGCLPKSPRSSPGLTRTVLGSVVRGLEPELSALTDGTSTGSLLTHLCTIPVSRQSGRIGDTVTRLRSGNIAIDSAG